MTSSKCEIYLHFVWTTFGRAATLEGEVERAIHACIVKEARRLECIVFAINGMPDHVHLLVKPPTKLSPAQLMKQTKGVSSAFARDQLGLSEFRWQEGYGVFSLAWEQLDRVKSYVENQKQRHAARRLWDDWEEPVAAVEARPEDASVEPGISYPPCSRGKS